MRNKFPIHLKKNALKETGISSRPPRNLVSSKYFPTISGTIRTDIRNNPARRPVNGITR